MICSCISCGDYEPACVHPLRVNAHGCHLGQSDMNIVDAKKRFGCLHDYLNNYLINNLKNNSHIIDLKFNDSLKIKIVVDKNGKIYSDGIDFKNSDNDTQKIKSIIYELLDSMPNIVPAVKTDYGIKVKSKFILPIILNVEYEF